MLYGIKLGMIEKCSVSSHCFFPTYVH